MRDAGWVPYWIDRMDEEWEKRQSEAPALKAKPSEYITRGNWFFAAEPEESTLPYVMDRIGDDKLIFASDYPDWGWHVSGCRLDNSRTQGYLGWSKTKTPRRKRQTALRLGLIHTRSFSERSAHADPCGIGSVKN